MDSEYGRPESLGEKLDREVQEVLERAHAGNPEEKRLARSLLATKYGIDREGFRAWREEHGGDCEPSNTVRLREKYRRDENGRVR